MIMEGNIELNKIDKKEIGHFLKHFATILESDEDIILDWESVMRAVHTVLYMLNVKVTDDVYHNLYDMSWEQIRWVLTKNRLHKQRVAVTPYTTFFNCMSDKHKNNIV